ncbi:MAG: ATP-binding protein [Bdellovibrionaceae bacterium]|nr:ATP-binding protein [Pseudobdellovibrionaceae bacterium]
MAPFLKLPQLNRWLVGLRLLKRRRGIVTRTLVAWLIGLFALSNDEAHVYDLRFSLRGEQTFSQRVVVLRIRPSNLSDRGDQSTNTMLSINEFAEISDSYYWDPSFWKKTLEKILRQNPRSVGVIPFFGPQLGPLAPEIKNDPILHDDRVIWAASTSNADEVIRPLLSAADSKNWGVSEIRQDEDGIVRRLPLAREGAPRMSEKLTGAKIPGNGPALNFRGPGRIISEYSWDEFATGSLPENYLTGKVILLAVDTTNAPQYLTPVGLMDKSQLLALEVDNILENRWIVRFPFSLYALFFFVLTVFAVLIITQFPFSVAFPLFVWLGTAQAAFSVHSFDVNNIWLPAMSPFILLLAVWVIFVGYQANRAERAAFRLEQDKKALEELEQLKNNFVSLISHDLKTPIAKIQFIVERMLSNKETSPDPDLLALRQSAEELNRYIQSILRVLRVESRDFKLHLEVSDINEVALAAIRQITPLAQEKSITIETDLEPQFSVELDVTLITEVMVNLLENAVKYTPRGGRITVITREIEKEICVSVKDTGQGIAPEDLELVWKKFVRGRNEDFRTKGSGLGLYLVKYFVELHGGSVKMESRLGAGSTVSFTLPLDREAVAPSGGQT